MDDAKFKLGISIGALSIFGLAIFNKILNYISTSKKINEYQSTTIYTASTLLESIQNQESQIIGKKVFIEGRVKLPKEILSRPLIKNNSTLVFSKVSHKNILSNDFYSGLQDDSNHGTRVISVDTYNFHLEDEKDKSVKIESSRGVELVNCLEEISREVKLDNLNFIQQILVYFFAGLKILKSALIIIPFDPPQIKIGVEEKTAGIRVGTFLCVLGEVTYAKNRKDTITIKKPEIFSKDIFCIINSLRRQLQKIKQNLVFFVLAGGVSACFVYKYFTIYNLEKKKIASKNRHKPGSALQDQIQNPDDEILCILCLTKIRCIIYKPCMHLASCKECDKKLKKRQCPCCRVAISDTIEIFGKN